jgi:hypothetical protein
VTVARRSFVAVIWPSFVDTPRLEPGEETNLPQSGVGEADSPLGGPALERC